MEYEKNMVESEDQYRRIVETAEEGIWICDPHGKTLFMNQKMADMLDWPREMLIGKSSLELQEIGCTWQACKNKKTPDTESSIHREYKLRRRDGGTIWTLVNSSPLYDSRGRYVGNLMMHTDITERKRLEEHLTRIKDELESRIQERTAELVNANKQYTRKLLEALEEERKRISRELHDDTAQYLALLVLEMDALIEREKQLPPEITERFKRFRSTASQALQEVRRVAHELRPNVLEHFGLATALELIISEFNAVNPVKVSFNVAGEEERLPDDTELTLFRVAQEGLNNIRKHSRATSADVTLTYTPGEVFLCVKDNGTGFDPAVCKSPDTKGGLGLIGMKERTQLVGAAFKIESQPGKGTVLTVTVPTGQ